MENKTEITTDGINLYINSSVQSKLIGRVILLALLIIFISGIIFGLSMLDADEVGKGVIIPFIMVIAMLYWGIKFLLWNTYGKELIIINSKSLSYKRSYGIIESNLTTLKFERLSYQFDPTTLLNDTQYGDLSFYKYREEDNLAEVLYEASVEISSETFDDIEEMYNQILFSEMNENLSFNTVSKN